MSKSRVFITFLFLTLLIFSFSFSQTAYLCLKLNNGSTVQYSVNDITKITFDNVTNIDDSRKIGSVLNSFKLLQNYPNPFNPKTSIQYKIPRKGTVEIKIFSINGKLIKSITNEHNKQGDDITKWDGKTNKGNSVASGFYIYRARFENNVVSKRMIFLK